MSADLRTLATVLSVIASPPELRTTRHDGDLKGSFDQWFDGGAVKVVTGWTEYHFAHGAVAVVPTTPNLRVDVRMPDGEYVVVSELLQAPLGFPPTAG